MPQKTLHTLVFILFIGTSIGMSAQADLKLQHDLGYSYMQQDLYVESYNAFNYYLQNASDEERYSETYKKASKAFHTVESNIYTKAEHCFSEAERAKKKGLQEKSDSLYHEYVRLCVTKESKETFNYTVALTEDALSLQRQGHFSEAIQQLRKVAEIRLTVPYMGRANAGESYNHIAAAEFQQGHYDEAIQACSEAADIYKTYYGPKNEFYGTTLSNLANYHISRNAPGDRQKAIEYGELAIKILPKSQIAYAHAMNNLVVYYTLAGDIIKAQKYAKDALKTTKKIEVGSINHASILSNQAIRLANVGNYEQASEYAREAISLFEANGETNTLNYARLLSNTASFEKHSEHYKEAIALWEQAAPIFESIEGKNGMGYLDCMSEISAAHARTGNLEQAANINETLQATVNEQVLKGDNRYARSLTRRASIMAADGNYQQAISLQQQALPIYRLRNDVLDEANTLNELSSFLYHTGQLQEAIDTCKQALKLYESVVGHEEDRALAYNSLSIYYYSDNKIDEALNASQQAVKYYTQGGDSRSSLYAKVLTNQALYESGKGNLDKAIQLSMQADSIQREVLGNLHPDNVMLRFNLANYYVRQEKPDSAQKIFHEAMNMQMMHVRSNFSHLTTRGRELYWGTKSYIFRAAPYMACQMEGNDSAMVDAYDAQLFTKGLLLNSEIDFHNLLARTASPRLQEKYAELEAIRQEVEIAWRNPTEENIAKIPALSSQATRLERDLIRGCKEFGDFTEALNISYSQVAKALGEEDAAIEFFDIETADHDRIYWGLVGRHGWAAPKLVRICSQKELSSLLPGNEPLSEALATREGIRAVFEDSRVGKCIWGNLIPLLANVKRVWFAPSGIFYQWGIEYLHYADQNINDLYELHRVSSTKLLAQSSTDTNTIPTQAAIFGGLDYDASSSDLQAANSQLSEVNHDYLSEYKALEEDTEDLAMAELRTLSGFLRDSRGTVGNLPGTEIEANMIAESLMMHDIDAEMYVGVLGTEEAFKQLSGRKIPLIHVATHGFALSEETVQQHNEAMGYLNISRNEDTQADNSLCYSGLLLSGANNVLRGQQLPEGLENGVLTAREIASLDLRGLSLAVLSACQTGMGELKEDGVFGLQRGFKKAGARTLLMSLWSVDDEATQIMMSQFYEALVSGQNRRQAFHTAQTNLRNNPRFSSPFFWASFVMLDD